MDQHPDVQQAVLSYVVATLAGPRDDVIKRMRQNYYAAKPQVVSDLRSLNNSVNAAAGVCAQDLSTVLPTYIKFAFDALP
jgi:2-phospho-L-lactate guanylyltransferase (CobY/MobA/RfbA family)